MTSRKTTRCKDLGGPGVSIVDHCLQRLRSSLFDVGSCLISDFDSSVLCADSRAFCLGRPGFSIAEHCSQSLRLSLSEVRSFMISDFDVSIPALMQADVVSSS